MSKFWRNFITNGFQDVIEVFLQMNGRTARGPAAGVEVVAVAPAGPAYFAGLAQRDIIVSLADRPVASLADLKGVLKRLPVAVPTTVAFLRGRRRLERFIVPSDDPFPAAR